MVKRVTIVLTDSNDKKLRRMQAKLIQETQGGYSFSRVINEIIEKSLK